MTQYAEGISSKVEWNRMHGANRELNTNKGIIKTGKKTQY